MEAVRRRNEKGALIQLIESVTAFLFAGQPGGRAHRQAKQIRLDGYLVRRLAAQRAALRESSGGVEREFLEIADDLETLARRSEELVKGSERLIDLSLGQTEGMHLLHEIPAIIQEPLGFVAKFNDEAGRLVARLRELDEMTGSLLQTRNQLTESFAPLGIIQVLYRIEAVQLTAEQRQVFQSLTEEMCRLEERVLQSFERQFAQLTTARRQLRQTTELLEGGVLGRAGRFQAKRAGIASLIERVNCDVQLNKQRESQLSRASREMAGHVNRAVMGIQHQDILRQRLQHVDQAVEKIEQAVTDCAKADRTTRRKQLALIHALCRLQKEQLAECGGELRQACVDVAEGTGEVVRTVRSVDEDCANLNDFGHVTASVDGMVQVLLDTLEDVRALLNETLTDVRKTFETIRPIRGQASDLTGIMASLSLGIQLIALNAQVQAGKLDNAPTLEVLSARTSDLAGIANQISLDVAGKLETFCRDMDDLVAGIEALQIEGERETEVLEKGSATAEGRLHAYRDATIQTLVEVSQVLTELHQLSGRRQSAPGSQEQLQADMAELAGLTENIAEVVAGMSRSTGLDEESNELLRQMQAGYTMASERSVHQRVVAAGMNPESSETVTAPAEDTRATPPNQPASHGLGDNIELF